MTFGLDSVESSEANPVCEVKYVPLELTDNSLVGSIDKVLGVSISSTRASTWECWCSMKAVRL